MTKADPIFNIRTLEVADLRLVEIEDASEGLSFGRRFKMKASADSCSEAMLFRDIFDDVKKIAKTAKRNRDLKKLEAVTVLLGKLDTANNNANDVYDTKGGLYHFLTFVSRLFSFGSHSKRISSLQESVTKQINLLDPVSRLTDLKNAPYSYQKSCDIRNLAQEFFDIHDYDHCLEAIQEDPLLDDGAVNLIAQISQHYLDNDDPEKALDTIKLINGNHPIKNAGIGKIADKYFNANQLDKAVETIQLSSDSQKKGSLISIVANKYYEDNQFEKGVETIELISYYPTVCANYVQRTLDTYFDDGKYEKAWELLPQLMANKVPFALKLGNIWCDNNDLENAHEVAAFIVEQNYLYTNQRPACEALIARVADAYCESGEPDKALEIVEPMKVVSLMRDDSALKNQLFEKIADAYIDLSKLEKAMSLIPHKISQDFKMHNRIIMKVAETYFGQYDDPAKALEAINRCNLMHYRNEINELKQKYRQAIL